MSLIADKGSRRVAEMFNLFFIDLATQAFTVT